MLSYSQCISRKEEADGWEWSWPAVEWSQHLHSQEVVHCPNFKIKKDIANQKISMLPGSKVNLNGVRIYILRRWLTAQMLKWKITSQTKRNLFCLRAQQILNFEHSKFWIVSQDICHDQFECISSSKRALGEETFQREIMMGEKKLLNLVIFLFKQTPENMVDMRIV